MGFQVSMTESGGCSPPGIVDVGIVYALVKRVSKVEAVERNHIAGT